MADFSGKFIVFDGNEGCGKSTQARMLRDHLEQQGTRTVLVRDPGTTRIGEQVRGILLNPDHDEMAMRCEMLLYMSARAQMMSEVILPALSDGACVLCDRFVSSTLAYQLDGDGMTAGEIRAVADIAIAGRWPDQTLILDMPVERSIARVTRAKDRIEQRPMAYHAVVRQRFLRQAGDNPSAYRVIDADRTPQAVQTDVLRAVEAT